ncbi:MAG: hypothetical protein IPN44_03540 [Flavobacteriales bacterium]|nr:hypothetical protein [Flavobacteriales bacterium]
MKLLAFIPVLLFTTALRAQSEQPAAPSKVYFSGSGELIFSAPILDVNGSDKGSVVRFSPFFNVQSILNMDVSEHVGFFTGLGLRNQGFIYQVPDTNIRYKFRTYNIGIPVGMKIGTMNKELVYFGYELELPFNYKEKKFIDGDREDRFDVWFGDRTERLFHSVFLGFQGPYGSNLTIRYYLNNFHNTAFKETKDGVTTTPYAGMKENIIAVSLGFGLFDKDSGRHHHSSTKLKSN